ncbi:MAG: ABC transporter substrate-binding protein [Chloroflexi bacterium]|nr:ABC transporter substrate-binding protein [Chloroflexota bacterium]
MIRIATRVGIALLVILSMGTALLAACGDGDGEGGEGTASPTAKSTKTTVTSGEPVVITIGNLTDLTGPASQGMDLVNKALADMAKYYNDKGYIPGVELEVIDYDGQLDPSKDVPGYEWLRGKGADLIWTSVPAAPTTLKVRVDEDRIVLFTPAIDKNELVPPGYTFCVAVVPQFEAYTLLKWIAENDWDYRAKGPAKIGGAGWMEGYSPAFMKAAEEYCQTHPDQFQWVGTYLTNFSF